MIFIIIVGINVSTFDFRSFQSVKRVPVCRRLTLKLIEVFVLMIKCEKKEREEIRTSMTKGTWCRDSLWTTDLSYPTSVNLGHCPLVYPTPLSPVLCNRDERETRTWYRQCQDFTTDRHLRRDRSKGKSVGEWVWDG